MVPTNWLDSLFRSSNPLFTVDLMLKGKTKRNPL